MVKVIILPDDHKRMKGILKKLFEELFEEVKKIHRDLSRVYPIAYKAVLWIVGTIIVIGTAYMATT